MKKKYWEKVTRQLISRTKRGWDEMEDMIEWSLKWALWNYIPVSAYMIWAMTVRHFCLWEVLIVIPLLHVALLCATICTYLMLIGNWRIYDWWHDIRTYIALVLCWWTCIAMMIGFHYFLIS